MGISTCLGFCLPVGAALPTGRPSLQPGSSHMVLTTLNAFRRLARLTLWEPRAHSFLSPLCLTSRFGFIFHYLLFYLEL